MRPYKNNHKRRFRSNNDRSFARNLDNQSLVSNTNFQRKPHRINNQSASRLIEKYTNLAREASTAGDKILSESYYQFSDHYLRVLNEREKNQNSINFEKEKPVSEKSVNDNENKEQKFDEKKTVTS
tara:strand:+ start:186 stop:563 length:378 start_codon:yes stop_codon:yes gene_type:complete